MKVLITGAGGFIGSHLVENLVKEGYSVRAFLRYTSNSSLGSLSFVHRKIIKEAEIFFGDLKNITAVKKAVHSCDAVIHLASVISVPYSYIHPREVVETNTLSTLNILEVLKENPRLMIHISSSEVYGNVLYTPIDENHPKSAKSPYAASKIFNDELVKSYGIHYNIPFKIIRPFNTFGPRQSRRAVISSIILQILNSKKVKIGNLFPERDFLYIDDTVKGIVLALKKEKKGINEEIILCSGTSQSIKDILEFLMKISGKKFEIQKEEKRIRPRCSEIPLLIGTYTKAKRILNFEPKIEFYEGLEKTFKWYKENQKFFNNVEVF